MAEQRSHTESASVSDALEFFGGLDPLKHPEVIKHAAALVAELAALKTPDVSGGAK